MVYLGKVPVLKVQDGADEIRLVGGPGEDEVYITPRGDEIKEETGTPLKDEDLTV